MSHNHSAIVVVVGEILFDLINGQKHLGGAPFNFAYHLLHLGIPVRFISRIGNDANGKEILNKLKGFQFPTADMQVDPDFETGTVHVELDRSGSPQYNIAAPVAYDCIEFIEDYHLSILSSAACLYFGSLVQRSPQGLLQTGRFLQNMPKSGECFYDINLRPDCYTEAVISQSLNHATILKLNNDELDVCRQLFAPETENSTFVRQLMDRFNIAQVVLTKGAHGCTLYDKNDTHESTPATVNMMSDSVGAGDAFAAMFCACTLNNCSPDQSLIAASHFAARICEISGAIPESPGFYAPYKKIIDQRTSHGII